MRLAFASIFTDHCVVQRDKPIAVWGQASAGELVVVTFADRAAETVAGPDGAWRLQLPACVAGGPHTLQASCAEDVVTCRDVLVGEVWLCSGQSNMEWELNRTEQGSPEDDTDLSTLRLLNIKTPASINPRHDVETAWAPATAESMACFSAVAVWFARELLRSTGVPVGLIANAWGGTRIEAWMSREALLADPQGNYEVQAFEAQIYASGKERKHLPPSPEEFTERAQLRYAEFGEGNVSRDWHTAEFDDGAWDRVTAPATWQSCGYAGSGIYWYRRRVSVPADWQGKALILELGCTDKHDRTWVNGTFIGSHEWDVPEVWKLKRRYELAPDCLTGDELVIAIRLHSHVNAGGLKGPAESMRVYPVGEEDAAIPLTGSWAIAAEVDFGIQQAPNRTWLVMSQNAPYALFSSRLTPVLPYSLRGVLWYQGESNEGDPANYRRLLPAMIADWRWAFGAELPFLVVQLANYRDTTDEAVQRGWAELRDAQLAASRQRGVAVAVTIDVGDANDIHPRDKRSVGERLARLARAKVYGEDLVPSGPMYRSVSFERGQMRIHFEHADGLCTSDGGAPARVAIAGPDRVFHHADAVIDGDTLVVSHSEVPMPVAVRYAWADNPTGCNISNATGLPASPFRTDCW